MRTAFLNTLALLAAPPPEPSEPTYTASPAMDIHRSNADFLVEVPIPFDTSDPDRSPTGHVQTWKDRQRETARLSAPSFEPRHMSRAQRRREGDFRTARQIIADDISTMRRE